MTTLFIVESPGKISKIQSYLGKEFIVKASIGHIMDLPKNKLGIDIENNFEPTYEITQDKMSVANELKSIAKKCDKVIFGGDSDREGVAINYFNAMLLGLKNAKCASFNEITKKALETAIANPIAIDMNMVHAQQGRRLLDRLVGFQISPEVTKSLGKKGLSAGRVQSVATKVIVEKEKDISESISKPYFKVNADFKYDESTIKSLLHENSRPAHFKDETIAENLIKDMNKKTVFIVTNVNTKRAERSPSAPFTTSTLQQEASTKLRLKVDDTMRLAQKLYESGYITYMRTDSTILSKDATDMCETYIKKAYGDDYHKFRQFATKSKNAQEAHEAVRPTKIDTVEVENLDDCHAKLYKLIWNRTVASQMANAQIDNQIVNIDAQNDKKTILPKNYSFVANFQKIVFKGFLIVYNNMEDEEELDKTIDINEDKVIDFNNLLCSQEYTKPPLRYNEALLVMQLEKQGIGRPSTFAAIIKKIIDRKYVEVKNIDGVEQESKIITLDNKYKVTTKTKKVKIGSEKNKLVPTELGITVTDFMEKNFSEIMDYKFTAKMEERLDKIAAGKRTWYKVLRDFQDTIEPKLEQIKNTKVEKKSMDEELGDHPDGGTITKGQGQWGPYVCLRVDGEKAKYGKIKGEDDLENITLKKAIKILIYPKHIGQIDKKDVIVVDGPNGFYCKVGSDNVSIKDKDHKSLTIDDVKDLMQNNNKGVVRSIKIKSKQIDVLDGPHSLYFKWTQGSQKKTKTFPKMWDVDKLDLSKVEFYLFGKQQTTTK
jgi:DNA topoisomerase-1